MYSMSMEVNVQEGALAVLLNLRAQEDSNF